jgi:nitrite reductase/ring-hydroxylating ferredoxin subunit
MWESQSLFVRERGSEDMGRYVVASVEEIPEGERKIVEIAGRSIGVFNVNGEYFALRNRCPHQGGPLCSGPVGGFFSSTGPGDYRLTRRGEILRCPWHGWEFDIRTGQSWFDPKRVRVRSYDVSLEPVQAEGDPATSHSQELEKGPYVAETYPVGIDQQHVVVEVPD